MTSSYASSYKDCTYQAKKAIKIQKKKKKKDAFKSHKKRKLKYLFVSLKICIHKYA